MISGEPTFIHDPSFRVVRARRYGGIRGPERAGIARGVIGATVFVLGVLAGAGIAILALPPT
jgi:hypothetical protein